MSKKRKAIASIEDLRQRTRLEEETGCWLYGTAIRANPTSVRVAGFENPVQIGSAIGFLLTGKKAAKGVVWHATCGNRFCCNPAHRKEGTRSTQLLAHNIKRSPAQVAQITIRRRAWSKISEDDCQRIRDSPLPDRELARIEGVSHATVYNIRTGKYRRPLAAPGSSVFAWMP